jgi:hypothetical protein
MSDEAQTEDEQLGDGGVKALQAERDARKAADKRVKDLEAKIAARDREDCIAAVAKAKGLTEAQAARLAGSTKEELEADADALLEAFKPSGSPVSDRPKEALRGGATPAGTEPELDYAAIVDKALRR